MRGGVDIRDGPVESTADDLTLEPDDRADGDLAGRLGETGLVERQAHEGFVHDVILEHL